MESLDQEDKEDQRGPGVSEAHGGRPESQEPRVRQVVMGPQVPPGRGDCLDLKERTGSLDRRGLLDLQGKMDCQDTQGSGEKWVSKGRLVHLALPALLVLRGPLVRPALWASVGIPAPRGLPENRASRGLLEKRERKATQESLDLPERMAHPV